MITHLFTRYVTFHYCIALPFASKLYNQTYNEILMKN